MKKKYIVILTLALTTLIGASLYGAYKSGEKEKDRQLLSKARHELSLSNSQEMSYRKSTEEFLVSYKYMDKEGYKAKAFEKGINETYNRILAYNSSVSEPTIKSNLMDYISFRVYLSSLDWKDTKEDYFKNIYCIARLTTEEYEGDLKGTIVKEIEIPYPKFIEEDGIKHSVMLYFVEKTGTDNNG